MLLTSNTPARIPVTSFPANPVLTRVFRVAAKAAPPMTSIITCSLMKSVENEVKGPRFWRTKKMAGIVPKRIPPGSFMWSLEGILGYYTDRYRHYSAARKQGRVKHGKETRRNYQRGHGA